MTCPECTAPSREGSRYCSRWCVEMAYRREMSVTHAVGCRTWNTGCDGDCDCTPTDAVQTEVMRLRSELALERGRVEGMTEGVEYLKREIAQVTASLEAARADRDAAVREADRWRHGVPIEGDYICPADLERDTLKAQLAECRAALKEACGLAQEHAAYTRRDVLDDRIAQLRKLAEGT